MKLNLPSKTGENDQVLQIYYPRAEGISRIARSCYNYRDPELKVGVGPNMKSVVTGATINKLLDLLTSFGITGKKILLTFLN